MAVFITGASSGIGRALALEYALQGHRIGLVARRADRLEAIVARLPGTGHKAYPVDVTDRASLHAAAQDFMATVGQVDIVIASAGVSAGTLTETGEDFEVFRDIFAINVMAMMTTFEPFVPVMKASGSGVLAGIASVAGVRGLPGAGAYSASKSAVKTYCESLRVELAGTGVDVVTVAPGYVESEMTAQNPYSMPFLLPADEFAKRFVRAVVQRRRYVVIPWQMAIVARLMAVLPDWLYDRLARNAPRKPRKPHVTERGP